MNEQTRKLLEKAARAVGAAETLLREGDVNFAAERAYYAMFYAAEALLTEKGLAFRKHGGVHSGSAEHFVKTGLFEPKFHRWLLDAFDQRLQGDYGVEVLLSPDNVMRVIARAREFLQAARQFMETAST